MSAHRQMIINCKLANKRIRQLQGAGFFNEDASGQFKWSKCGSKSHEMRNERNHMWMEIIICKLQREQI